MRFRRYTGVVVFLLVIAILLFLFVNPRGSMRMKSSQMLLSDPLKIDRVRIAGAIDTVILSRSGETWMLPGAERANQVAVENLLFAAQRLQVDAIQTDPPERDNVVAKEVSFLNHEKLVLQYTLMERDGRLLLLLPGSEKAFTVSLPGFPELELIRVFSDSQNHFREHMLIELLPVEIRQIEVERRGYPTFRFTRDEYNEMICELPGSDSLLPMELIDKESVRMLFTYFTSIRYEEKADLQLVPSEEEMKERWLARIYVESEQGERHTLQVYSLPGDAGEKDHMFRAMVIHNNSAEPLVIKYIYLDVLMRGLPAYFGDNPLRH
ncbi:MAG: hypothetical protein R6W31_02435 [Bacteroidales bacterium]